MLMRKTGQHARYEVENDKPIWIIATDTIIKKWARTKYGPQARITSPEPFLRGPNDRPAKLLLPCNYQCSFEKCARLFNLAHNYNKVPIGIVRPVILRDAQGTSVIGVVASDLRPPDSTNHKERPTSYFQPIGPIGSSIYPNRIVSAIIQVQEEIIASVGHVNNMGKLAKTVYRSRTWLSFRFKQVVGLSPKDFSSRIRLCHCLWCLISGEMTIKAIAFGYGYEPSAFSRRFFCKFKVWPNDLRDQLWRRDRYLWGAAKKNSHRKCKISYSFS